MSIMSLLSLTVSVLGTIVYSSLFSGSGLTWLFIILSIASIVLPPIAKKLRIAQGKKGKAFEIIAIVIGGFNFYGIVLALTTLPLLVGYLGWVISGIAYKMVKCSETSTHQAGEVAGTELANEPDGKAETPLVLEEKPPIHFGRK